MSFPRVRGMLWGLYRSRISRWVSLSKAFGRTNNAGYPQFGTWTLTGVTADCFTRLVNLSHDWDHMIITWPCHVIVTWNWVDSRDDFSRITWPNTWSKVLGNLNSSISISTFFVCWTGSGSNFSSYYGNSELTTY